MSKTYKNINNQLTKQISCSSYIDSNMNYDHNSDLSNKLYKFKYIYMAQYIEH